ncbi:MAG TPA: AAA family ATPase [Thermoanaerobaculia bacterium]|nr:AAA family ATPase [Thermoanaerobaculia bacterium]
MPEPIGPTRVVTFYSYKGGVGRTLALVNTAHVLALEGWRVLMVDFDLEAPGMTHFFANEVRRRPAHVRKDSLDLLVDARRSLAEADSSGRPPEYPRSLAEYVVPLTLPEPGEERLPSGIPYRNGRLDLIPATLEPRKAGTPSEEPPPDYVERLRELDLENLFQSDGPGHRFGDHVRSHFLSARFEAPGDILFALRDSVTAAYDVVLIDSRTGLNEIAGFSIGTVADSLVLCCGLNQQNVEGTRYFMKKIGLFNRKKAKRFVMAVGPVPPWLTPDVEERLRALRRALHLRQDTSQPVEDLPDRLAGDEGGSLEAAFEYPEMVEIPYHPLAAVREVVFVTELPRDSISQAYVSLAGRIRSKLLPGALEGAEKHFHFLSLLRNPSPEGLRSFCEAAARQLPQIRLLRNLDTPIPVYSTAWGVASLPERRQEIRWEDLSRISVAAAVAALHTDSASPFERAWVLLSTLQNEGHQRFLARCLIYFQSPTPYSFPEGALSSLIRQSEGDLDRYQYFLSNFCALLVKQKLISSRPGILQSHTEKNEVMAPSSFRLATSSIWRWSRRSIDDLPRLLTSVQRLAAGNLRKGSKVLAFLKDFYRLPAESEDILSGEAELAKLSGYTLEMTFDRSAYSETPIGLWPEPLAATALAAAEGAGAIKEILAWLHLARLHYGYAWRVLIDWRYFDEAKSHPRFQAFLREEDEIVAAVEAKIDRGELPL